MAGWGGQALGQTTGLDLEYLEPVQPEHSRDLWVVAFVAQVHQVMFLLSHAMS